MSIIPMLEGRKRSYNNEIANKRNQIARCERAYESLCSFKTIVVKSQETFHAINAGKSSILEEVNRVKRNSIIAQKYYTGMQNILSGIGSKIVGVVYSVLVGAIATKMHSYVNEINDCENSIESYERKIRDVDRQIRDARRAEELARKMLEGAEGHE